MILDLVKAQLAKVPAWNAFQERRRESLRRVLAKLVVDAKAYPTSVEECVDKHVDEALEAGLPLGELAKLLGADALLAIASKLKG